MMTSEEEWIPFLKDKPQWSGPEKKTIILSPHPDDETLGAGGLISNLRKQNIEVQIIAITDGENAYPSVSKLAKIRQKEQEKALHILGVCKENIIRLKLKDGSLNHDEKELEHLLRPYFSPQVHIIAPWVADYHADHEAVGRVALKIAQQKKLSLSFYFFWTWHHTPLAELQKLPLKIYPLDNDGVSMKKTALNCYVSQYFFAEQQAILPQHLLLPAQRSFEVFYNYEY